MGNGDGGTRYTSCQQRLPSSRRPGVVFMERFLTVAGAQVGPIARNESRRQVVSRLLELIREAKARGSDMVRVLPSSGADVLPR